MGLLAPRLPPFRSMLAELEPGGHAGLGATRLLCVERALRSPGASGFVGRGHQWFLALSDANNLTAAIHAARVGRAAAAAGAAADAGGDATRAPGSKRDRDAPHRAAALLSLIHISEPTRPY